MQRIDTASKAVDLFGAGKHGFKDGNVGLGIAATQFNAAICNNVQEEIVRVVEAAGITLNGTVYTQLLAALSAGWGIAKSHGENGYQSLPGGLILQWGQNAQVTTAAGFQTITFPIAFPASVYTIVLSNGDAGAIADAWPSVILSATTLSSFTTAAYRSNGSPVASTSFRVNWFAVGK